MVITGIKKTLRSEGKEGASYNVPGASSILIFHFCCVSLHACVFGCPCVSVCVCRLLCVVCVHLCVSVCVCSMTEEGGWTMLKVGVVDRCRVDVC